VDGSAVDVSGSAASPLAAVAQHEGAVTQVRLVPGVVPDVCALFQFRPVEVLVPVPVWMRTDLPAPREKVSNLYTWLDLSRTV
jgi:hypothetical protein